MKYIKFTTNQQFKQFKTLSGIPIDSFILIVTEYFCNLPSNQGTILSFDLYTDIEAYNEKLQQILVFDISNPITKRNEAIQLAEFNFTTEWETVFAKLVENFKNSGFNVQSEQMY